MKKLKAERTVSRGIAVAKAYVHLEADLKPAEGKIADEQKGAEFEAFIAAREAVAVKLEEMGKTNDIFAAHATIVRDPMLEDGVRTRIEGENCNAQQALDLAIRDVAAVFESLEDEYFRARAADVRDIGKQIMATLKGVTLSDFSNLNEPVIIVARDLYPSDTAKIDLNTVMGIITQEGGVTSHVSIMAKNMGLPALVGVEGVLNEVIPDKLICMNAKTGDIVINPDEATVASFMEEKKKSEEREAQLSASAELPVVTKDGKAIQVYANVGGVKEALNCKEHAVKGSGLFRSEFLYMDNDHFPTEEEQFEAYRDAATALPEELTIRTLDIGGDKSLSYYEFDAEENPFLGWRAIRISLDREDLFRTQLRAILRASAFGHVRIMFPMIISLNELRRARSVVERCMAELDVEGIAYDPEIEIGIMIETPASVLMADALAAEADFFSIGTNDLTQYILVVDRGNKKISDLYNTLNPAVLKAIDTVIQAGHAHGIKVGMCGEFASDERVTPLLLGYGLDEFSMAVGETANIKDIVRNTDLADARALADRVRQATTTDEVMELLGSTTDNV